MIAPPAQKFLNLPTYTFINGPPGSGKSTLAKLLCDSAPGVWRESFAEPIRQMIYAVFFPEEGPTPSTDLRDAEVKKSNLAALSGLGDSNTIGGTIRKTMIDFSEDFMKPRFGEDVFGRLLYKRCEEQLHWYDTFVIDDNGFAPEAQYVISQAGAQSCCLIRLHRDGCDYSSDSRSYVDLPIRTLDLNNNAAPHDMLSALQLEFGNI